MAVDLNRSKEALGQEILVCVKTGRAEDLQDAAVIIASGKADLDQRDEEGFTALHHAAMQGFTGTARQLLDAGADRSIVNIDKKTAAYYAEKFKHFDIADMINEKPLTTNDLLRMCKNISAQFNTAATPQAQQLATLVTLVVQNQKKLEDEIKQLKASSYPAPSFH